MHILNNQEIIHNDSNLKFDFTILDSNIKLNETYRKRNVVRGVSIINNKLLVVYPKNNEIYGTPGGGVNENEDKITALKRELQEEVGAIDVEVIEYIGKMDAFRYDPNKDVFNPIHHYYHVKINSFGKQKLDDYENDLELQYDYIDIDVLIDKNIKGIQNKNQKFADFYSNQVVLFKQLKELGLFSK